MDEPTALLAPVSTRSLSELLKDGPLPMAKGLELLGVIAGALAKLHAAGRSHGGLSASIIRVQTFENGRPMVVFADVEATRDMSAGADAYALGVLAHQVLGGRAPGPAETFRDLVPAAAPAVEKLVGKLMSPKPTERLTPAAAERQLLDLAATLADPEAKPAAPLAAKPQLKKKTAANPFGDDEATHTASMPGATEEPLPELTPPAPKPRGRAGPALEDEPTQFAPMRWSKQRDEAPEHTPLPPPVPTPGEPMQAVRRAAVPEPTRAEFEPSRSDLPGNTADGLVDPRLQKRRPKRSPAEQRPASGLAGLAKKQPPWVWAVLGVGLLFFGLLLIALAR